MGLLFLAVAPQTMAQASRAAGAAGAVGKLETP